jgi:hypothetical protein
MPLTEDQLDFTERHMSAEKETPDNFVEHNGIPGGFDLVAQADMKLNSSIAGSKVIYEDDSVIDVPVVPMREGVFTGTDGIPTLKKFEYFGKDAHWLEGQPILKGHTSPTEFVTYKHNRIGKLMNVTARPDKKDVVAVARYYKEKLTPEDMARIKSGNPYDGSIAYTTHTSFVNGEHSGHKYNAVEDGGYHFYHFAELANGTGACSTKDGCGFMLNEKGFSQQKSGSDSIKIYYNKFRRAEISQSEEGQYAIKLNSTTGGSGVLQIDDLDTANEWSQIYVRSGKIPVSMKLNYNCPDSEKSGSGKGSCGGSDKGSSTTNQVKSDKISNRYDKKTLGQTVKSGLTAAANAEPGPEELKRVKELGSKLESKGLVPGTPLFEKNAKDYNDKLNIKLKKEASISESDGRKLVLDAYDSGISIEELSNPDNIDKQLDQAMDDAIESGFLEDWEGTNYSSKGPKGRFEKAWRKGYNKALLQLQKQKQNSQFKQLQNINGNTMTEEEFIAPETDVSETVQKLNADFEQKLNERDAKIAELETQLGILTGLLILELALLMLQAMV